MPFRPQNDIPDLSDKICLVTGGNSGLGEETLAALAQHKPKRLYLGARSRAKAEAAIARIRATSSAAALANIEVLELDLASLQSVKAAAARVNSEADRLDILQLNGGIGEFPSYFFDATLATDPPSMSLSAMTPFGTTKDGYEVQFGTNYLGHALLTQLLMPKLLATAKLPGADVRIVSMASKSHQRFATEDGIQFDLLKTDMSVRSGGELYGQAMLAKILFAYELAKRYPQITSSSLHPGIVKTGAYKGDKSINWYLYVLLIKPLVALMGVSVEEGVKTQLWCSFSKDTKNGRYYEPIGQEGQEGKHARSDALSEKLWKWTEDELRAVTASNWPTGV